MLCPGFDPKVTNPQDSPLLSVNASVHTAQSHARGGGGYKRQEITGPIT